jgi:uncharacterized protein (TIGR02145 family)
MKRLLTILVIVLLTVTIGAQSPQKMSYQAVIRDGDGKLVTTQIGMQISILQGSDAGIPVYVETHTPTPNSNGLASLIIGDGTWVSGNFATIDWSNGPYYIKTETAVAVPLTSYTISGTSQLLSIPYALYAKTAETADYNDLANLPTLFNGDWSSLSGKPTTITGYGITDAFNGTWASLTGKPAGNNPGDMLYWNGATWLLVPAGQPGQFLQFTASNIPAWSGPAFSTITTDAVSSVTGTNATSGGNITNDGGASVSARGVCWNTVANPTIMNSKTTDGTGTGTFTSSMTGLSPSTNYYVRAYATNSAGTVYGNEINFATTSAEAPTLSTTEVTIISPTSSSSGGNITSDGGAAVTSRGVCWSESANPTIALVTRTDDGAGTGTFISTMAGLTAGTTYHVRAYATNTIGTNYGNEIIFSAGTVADIDGNVYNTVTIGTQLWMVENLKSTKYNNGESIGTTDPTNLDISGETDPKYQWAYSGNEANAAIYGRLYTWFTVTDSRGVCPDGWHVPTHNQWTTMEDYLIANGYNYDGTTTGNKIAKALGSATLWQASGAAGAIGNTDYPEKINVTGFTSLPTGYRHPNLSVWYYLGEFGHLWSVDQYDEESGWFLSTCNAYNYTLQGGGLKKAGMAVRCLKD